MIVNYIIFSVIGIWLLILTVGVVLVVIRFQRLTRGVKEGDLLRVLKKILTTQDINTKEISEINKKIQQIEISDRFHLQKIGLVRFNPFEEIGGDHSFSAALLDGTESGFIITGLHTRDRTRIYVKEIRKGKGQLELSTEEEKALKRARNIN